jgi:enoyl-CoA hydratase/carnithine racemase
MDYEHIRFEVADAVATVTLNRPERLNAYTTRMGEELRDAFGVCDRRDDVRAVIVTGAGRAFCAGADLEGGGRIFEEREAPEDGSSPRGGPPPAWRVRKPIIGAINGAAVGVGATLPMQWDIRIAGESARIGFVFVRRGLVPEAASTWTLPRIVGMSRAAELLYTGRIVNAREALEFGLVSRVVPDAELLPTAHAMARDIAVSTGPVAVALTKRLLWHMQGVGDPAEANAVDLPAFVWSTQSPDAREGIHAFLEKREPRLRMRPSVDLPEPATLRKGK